MTIHNIERIANRIAHQVTAGTQGGSNDPYLSDTNVAYSSYLEGMKIKLVHDTLLWFIRYLSKGTRYQGKAGGMNIQMERRLPKGYARLKDWDKGVQVEATVTFKSKGILVEVEATREGTDDEGYSESEDLGSIKKKYSLDRTAWDVGNEVGSHFNKYLRD